MLLKVLILSFFFFLVSSLALGQSTFEKCHELWLSTSEMVECQMKANEAKKHEISLILKNIEQTFRNKGQVSEVLNTQSHWESYIESECRSRMIPSASGSSNAAYYHICLQKKLEDRIKELEHYHDCYDNGCPERI